MKKLLLAAAGLVLATAAAGAFGVEPGERGVGSEHERITRAAATEFGGATLDALVAAVNLPDLVKGPSDSVAHCDGGDYLTPDGGGAYGQSKDAAAAALTACRALIVDEIDVAVQWAGQLTLASADSGAACDFTKREGSPKCQVLRHLGRAFHTAQDFYAHTNWVDKAAGAGDSPDDPPGLGHKGRAPWLDPRATSPLPDGLISGCVPEVSFADVALGCEYGDWAPFFGSRRVNRADLSKDLGPIGKGVGGVGMTRRGVVQGNFARAVAAAVEDTADKWDYFKESVRAKYKDKRAGVILCMLTRDKTDAAACSTEGAQAAVCATRSGSYEDGAPPTPEETTLAETLWPELREACRLEEADLTRSLVMGGASSEAARGKAKESAVAMLAHLGSCPVQARAQLDARAAAEKATFAQIHLDCVLAARLRQLTK